MKNGAQYYLIFGGGDSIQGTAELKSKRNLLWTQKAFCDDQYFE